MKQMKDKKGVTSYVTTEQEFWINGGWNFTDVQNIFEKEGEYVDFDLPKVSNHRVIQYCEVQ